jgi:hypothetical protein
MMNVADDDPPDPDLRRKKLANHLGYRRQEKILTIT